MNTQAYIDFHEVLDYYHIVLMDR